MAITEPAVLFGVAFLVLTLLLALGIVAAVDHYRARSEEDAALSEMRDWRPPR